VSLSRKVLLLAVAGGLLALLAFAWAARAEEAVEIGASFTSTPVLSAPAPSFTLTPAEIQAPPRLFGADHPFAKRGCERCWWVGSSVSFAASRVFDSVATYEAMGRGAREVGLGGLGILSGQGRGTVIAVSAAASFALWAVAYWIREAGGPPWLYDGLLIGFSGLSVGAGIHNLQVAR